ncbi:MAG: hypothetical protein KC561_18360, partial [Myxococcales bacterium]|nr:hypothetical protein [Myxococcales bacterium]
MIDRWTVKRIGAVAAFGLASLSSSAMAQDGEDELIFDPGDETEAQPAELHPALIDEDRIGNPEHGFGDDEEDEGPLSWEFSIRSEIHSYNNLDLRPTDESTDQAVIDTDDRQTFAYSSLYGAVH